MQSWSRHGLIIAFSPEGSVKVVSLRTFWMRIDREQADETNCELEICTDNFTGSSNLSDNRSSGGITTDPKGSLRWWEDDRFLLFRIRVVSPKEVNFHGSHFQSQQAGWVDWEEVSEPRLAILLYMTEINCWASIWDLSITCKTIPYWNCITARWNSFRGIYRC